MDGLNTPKEVISQDQIAPEKNVDKRKYSLSSVSDQTSFKDKALSPEKLNLSKLNITQNNHTKVDKIVKEWDDEPYYSPLLEIENKIPVGLTFDDVLLIPQYSTIESRNDISLETKFSTHVPLKIPLVSSPMDTVTEAEMAIEMARYGGLGIIHRFNTIQEQCDEIRKVKRRLAYVIKNPYTLHLNTSINKVNELIAKFKIQTFLVTEETFCNNELADFSFRHKLVGIVTRRDFRKYTTEKTKIKEIMTPRDRMTVLDENDLDLNTAKQLMISKCVEKVPVVNEKNEILGLVTLKDINRIEECPQANVDTFGKLYVGAAVGANKDYIERAKKLIDTDCDVLVVDIANGHSQICIDAVERLKEQFSIDVVAGSIASGDAALKLIKAGADGIRCGIGSGSICTTRIVAGAGVPQLSAIFDTAPICLKYGIPLISDGGNRCSGNMCKALGAGASCIMVGRLIAGCDESPGRVVLKDSKRVKIYRGMAGLGANMAKAERSSSDLNIASFNAEGVEGYIPYIGPLKETLFQFSSGIRSGMSYCGARTITEMPSKAKFIRLTQSGIFESGIHDINKF